MSFVILGHCCKDASCVQVCPQNCIRPSPDQPEFDVVEHLYIDPNSCIDCAACAEACPADSIKPEVALTDTERLYARRSSEYFADIPTAPATRSDGPRIPRSFGRNNRIRRVAVVGAGTAAVYTVRELLQRSTSMRVTVFEQRADTGGLLRTAVSPNHTGIRNMVRLFDIPFSDPRVETRFDTRVGADVSIADLRRRFDAVVLAFGASRPRDIGSPDVAGMHQALSVLTAANTAAAQGNPAPVLAGPTVAIVGGGNVALDVTAAIAERRIVTRAGEPISRVVLVARSSVLTPSFTLSALDELVRLDIDISIDSGGQGIDGDSADPRLRLLADATDGDPLPSATALPVDVVFGQEVTELRGSGGRMRVVTASRRHVVADSVVVASGSTCTPLAGVPLDADGVVSNREGRVVAPETGAPIDGLYVVGWAKRGARGGVGDNRRCAAQTVDRIVADSNGFGG